MKKEKYNWWTDPKNKEEVEKLSWWDHEENQITLEIPVAITNSENYWTISTNDKTKELIGDIPIVAQGDSKEEVIKNFFETMKFHYYFNEERVLKYSRWVPLKIGPGGIAGNWFSIFGFHIYFRYGKNMKGGFYIPFTKLNISGYNEWKQYKNKYKINAT